VSAAREEMLGRVRAALAEAPPPEPPAEAREFRQEWEGTREQMLERFADRVNDYNAVCQRVGPGELEATLERWCAEAGAARVAVPPGLPAEWRPAGVDLVEDGGLSAHELDRLGGALTGCEVAIAETGTIVLDGGAHCGRRALTLVPDLHLCVLEAERVVGLVPEAIEALGQAAAEGRPLTFVSGPSATSDIELSRVEGVHGPRALRVALLG
jgi:L-lactate dehydrogenase complex protein LldG